jgi:HK97 family phage prohead protease
MIKASGPQDGLEEGQFEALVSAFGNLDSQGDIVMKGAFADSLKDWEASGNPIPVYWSHRMDDPDFNLGQVLTATETDQGLHVKAQLDLSNPKAAQVYQLFKGRRVTQFSFAYDIVDFTETDTGAWELNKLKLYEVGPTPIGANQETDLLAVKSMVRDWAAKAKSGRVFSAKNEDSLRSVQVGLESAVADIKNLLAAIGEPPASEQGSTASSGPANAEEPSPANAEEPSHESVELDNTQAEYEIRGRLLGL